MNYDRPPATIPATPGYVLDVIRDSHRQQAQLDPGSDPDVELTFETTVAEWRSACDLVDWRRLGRALDVVWKLGRSDPDWRPILEPARKRTLRDVCEFIASGALRPSIEPLRILGATCLPAGAFLAIRSLLRDAGADVDAVTPSTPLDLFSSRHLGVFLGPISHLAPNTLPDVRVFTPRWQELPDVGLLLGPLIALAGCYVSPILALAGTMMALISWILANLAASPPPRRVEFGNLRTFRDLAVALAEGTKEQAECNFPTSPRV